jgi:hypothetical protein
MRNPAGHHGIPLWKSTDGGVTFATNPVIVLDGVTNSDKPWITVDNAPGTGQHDVYLACMTRVAPFELHLSVATNGNLASWNDSLLFTLTNKPLASPVPVIGPNHTAYIFWLEGDPGPPETFQLKMRKAENRGSTLGAITNVVQLTTTNPSYGNLQLLRSNTAASTDAFRAFPFPVPAANPVKTDHLYVAFADKGTNADKADVFFIRSSDGGATWTNLVRVNTDATTNDQWMPVLAVKPDGTKLFMAWHDRRNDTNNSLMDVYGCFGTILANGEVAFSTNQLRITTTNFPPVFVGTLSSNTNIGHYDPVYPGRVNLHWHYAEWPEDPNVKTFDTYKDHVGEYEGAWADGQSVYVTWSDGRLPSVGTQYPRSQRDIRFVRITWPQ